MWPRRFVGDASDVHGAANGPLEGRSGWDRGSSEPIVISFTNVIYSFVSARPLQATIVVVWGAEEYFTFVLLSGTVFMAFLCFPSVLHDVSR